MKPERYHSIVDEMDATVKGHPGGWADKEALAKIASLVSQIRAVRSKYIDAGDSRLWDSLMELRKGMQPEETEAVLMKLAAASASKLGGG
jgi:hypothetical protein